MGNFGLKVLRIKNEKLNEMERIKFEIPDALQLSSPSLYEIERGLGCE